MNYRHAYHAGNFADVLKHAMLAMVIEYLKLKPQSFRVIDVHAGIGLYDLESVEAGKTREWEGGIGRLWRAELPEAAARHLAPYLDAVKALNPGGELRVYPGSPRLARALMRRGDPLIANELHPEDFARLKSHLADAPDTKVLNLDAWVALKSLLPPKERRGLVLIDPPFEARDEFERLGDGLATALERFATGIYLIWFPVKSPHDVAALVRRVRGHGARKGLCATLAVGARGIRPGLTETGILIINPPYLIKDKLAAVLPALSTLLSEGPGSGFDLKAWSE